MILKRQDQHDETGSSAVEWALITGLILLVFLGATYVALGAWANTVLQAAAEEGASQARAFNGSASSGHARAETYVDRLSGDLLSDFSVRATRSSTTASVTITGHVKNPLGFRMTVKAKSAGPVERYVETS